jgi:hypothetical protein
MSLLLAEEASALAWAGEPPRRVAEDQEAHALLAAPAHPVADIVRSRMLTTARSRLDALRLDMDAFARDRAATLADDHALIRRVAETEAARLRGTVRVVPVLPSDVIGLYVLLPVL